MSGVSQSSVSEGAATTAARFDDGEQLVDRVARFAAAVPEAPALVCDGRVMTYGDLHQQLSAVAESIARWPGGPIAAVVGHDDRGLVAVLAAMKARRPLVPLDPLIPTARLATMLKLSRAATILTDEAHLLVVDSLGVGTESVLQIETATALARGKAFLAAPDAGPADSDEVACVFFTSGSTGIPKGVPWSHRMLACEADSGIQAMKFAPTDRMALVLPFSFSAGMGVVSWALGSGAALHVFDPRLRSVSELRGWLVEHRITTLHSTPSLMRSLIGVLAPGELLPDLRIVMTCAEPVLGKEVATLRRHLSPSASYVNWTGASEVGTIALNEFRGSDPLPDGVIPNGRSVPARAVQIRNEDGELVPVGQPGEVTVVSHYIAQGYWHDVDRTAAKFRSTDDGRRIYRTGDLGRLSASGVLELLGRIDKAVKVRGYLVEPIEVEAALLDLDDVIDAVVIGDKRPGAQTRLVAYVASPPASRISPAAIRGQLRDQLPEWMIPTVVVQLDVLPRTERGKVDLLALPAVPEGPQAGFVAPRTPWEIMVAEIWSGALQLHEIGIHDDFSELGGDSLVAEEILSRTASELDLRLPSAALLEAPTVAEFAAFVEHASTVGGFAASQASTPSSVERALPDDATVVPLKATGSLPPVFCFAGAGGLALTFLPLVRRLGADQPAWGLQEHGLERRGFADWSVGGAARRHLRAIRAIQPTGPYILVGYSFGGLVAYEAGRRLLAAGEEVTLMVTLDTVLPGTVLKTPRSVVEPTTDLAGVPVQRGTVAPKAANKPHGVQRFNPIQRIRHSQRPVVKILRNAHRMPLAGLVRFSGTDHYDVFFCKGMLASHYYRMKSWPGHTLVVVAKDNEEELDNRKWKTVLSGSWRMEYVSGDHHSIWREPHVHDVADLIRREIEATRRPQPEPHLVPGPEASTAVLLGGN